MTATPPREQAVLVLVGRGELPFALLHGTPLYLHALSALRAVERGDVVVLVEARHEARVADETARRGLVARVLTVHEWWGGVRAEPAGTVLLHDPLCPLVAPDFLRIVRARARELPGTSVAAYRPVTDTVKTVVDDRVDDTIDREGLAAVVAPVVVSGDVLAGRTEPGTLPPPLADFGHVVQWLRERGPVALVKAPSLARRVEDDSAVNLLECVDELSRRMHHEGGGSLLSDA